MEEERASLDEILGSCLESVQSGRETIEQAVSRYPQQAEELRALLETAFWFSGHKTVVSPRPGFVQASKHRLMEQIKAGQPQPVTSVGWFDRIFGIGRSSHRLAFQLVLSVVVLACLVLSASGIGYAAQGTLPGEALYSVKIGLEQAQLAVTLDEAHEIRLHAQFSQRRLGEIESLIKEGHFNEVQQAVANFQYHVNQATTLLNELALQNPQAAKAVAAELQDIYARETALLSSLALAAPADFRSELQRAAIVSESGQAATSAVLATTSGLPTPTPTLNPFGSGDQATPTGFASLYTPTPAAGLMITVTATSNATITLAPSATPSVTWTPTATLLPSSTVRPPSPTPTKGGPVQINPTPTNTPHPTDTPVPHDTPIPPQETPKPPKPTKTPRPTSLPAGKP